MEDWNLWLFFFGGREYWKGDRRLNSKTNPRSLLLVLSQLFFAASNSSASDCTIVLTVPQVNAISSHFRIAGKL
ncbi:hypothetical protein Pyn_26483 [Prunus yedoensis var. nudiflora]|uniref:Uncharacterized protein n=1 Tax=Prunus yedoensis var. nudiflora TaxID=2094558 RepID=A0A314V046_PRUYE|nr:hypothetical protein Pyn_26483 [Prunus yedoensis var. nudiflora]